jgi:hypothetical protein
MADNCSDVGYIVPVPQPFQLIPVPLQGGQPGGDGPHGVVQEDAKAAGEDGGHMQARAGAAQGDFARRPAGHEGVPVPVPQPQVELHHGQEELEEGADER